MEYIKLNDEQVKTFIFESIGQSSINTSTINVLVACEESQAITAEFRKRGFNAFSCDLQDCSGGHPEWHIKGDCLPLLKGNKHTFITSDGQNHTVGRWNLIMAHPPCTYLTTSGNRWFNVDKYGEKALQRLSDREDAEKFFMEFTKADADHIAIENPVGCMSSSYKKPNQIIQPWMWGDHDVKKTCLWTQNLPNLEQDFDTQPEDIKYKEWVDKDGKKKRQAMSSYSAIGLGTADRQRTRSKTYPGIAKAIAQQWGNVLIQDKLKESATE